MKSEITIIQDSREKIPWKFDGYNVVVQKLDAGDYQIKDSDLLVIERKATSEELWKNLVMYRERFMNEMRLMRGFRRRIIICEFDYNQLMQRPSFFKKKISPHYIQKILWEIYMIYGVSTFCLGNDAESYAKSLIKRVSEIWQLQ